MPVTRTYECPDCGHQFRFLHMNRDEPPPEHCPACGNYMGETPQAMPSLFSIKSRVSKSGDQVYRAMEDASAARAEQVEAMTGESASHMRITNMRDNQRQGDVAAVTPPNEVQKVMQQAPKNMGYQSSDAIAGFVGQAKAGPYAGAGHAARQQIGMSHFQTAAQITRAGNLGVHRRKG